MTKEKDYLDFWAEGTKVPPEALERWRKDPNHKYHCSFEGAHGTEKEFLVKIFDTHNTLICPECHEYKGIEPCIPGYCSWGEQ